MHEAAVDRLERSAGLGTQQLARLQRSRVAIVGVGALGGPVASHLAMLGVGIDLIDHDTVSIENLANQGFLYRDVGEPKAEARARELRAIDPDCQDGERGDVRAWPCRVEDVGLGTFAGVDLIVSALDSVSARAIVSEIATSVGVPMLDAAVDGSGKLLQGNVAAFHPAVDGSPCFLCRFDASSFREATRAEQPRGCPGWRDRPTAVTPPTLQGSAFGAIVAGIEAIWAVRLLAGDGHELLGRRLYLSCEGPEPRARLVTLDRREPCLIDHAPLEPVVERHDETIGESLAAAEHAAGAAVEEARFHHRTLARGLFCRQCGAVDHDFVHVAATTSDEDAACRSCGGSMAAAALTTTLDRADLDRMGGKPWQALGLPERDIVSLSCGGDPRRELHVLQAGPREAGEKGDRR